MMINKLTTLQFANLYQKLAQSFSSWCQWRKYGRQTEALPLGADSEGRKGARGRHKGVKRAPYPKVLFLKPYNCSKFLITSAKYNVVNLATNVFTKFCRSVCHYVCAQWRIRDVTMIVMSLYCYP